MGGRGGGGELYSKGASAYGVGGIRPARNSLEVDPLGDTGLAVPVAAVGDSG